MALGKHNVRGRLLAGRIAQRLGDAVVAPVVAYVPEGSITPPAGHMWFAGTITILEAAFESILEASARSFCQHGLRDVFFLGDHGRYKQIEGKVAARLNGAADPGQLAAVDINRSERHHHLAHRAAPTMAHFGRRTS